MIKRESSLFHSSSSRRPELDLLRAVAILLVLGRHLLCVPDTAGGVLGSVFRAWKNFGWIGVDLFFVLSGYLVGGLLIREGLKHHSIDAPSFLFRRGFRIYPAFYILLIGSVLIRHFIGLQFPNWPNSFFHEVFFVQDYLPGIWPQTWSLGVEEQFYLFLLALTLWMVRRHHREKDPFKSLPRWILTTNLLIFVGRLIEGYVFHPHWSILTFQAQWRIDSLLFGVLLFYGLTQHPSVVTRWRNALSPWRPMGLSLLLGPCLILDLNHSRYVTTIGFSTLYLGLGWILLDLRLASERTKSHLLRTFPLFPLIGRCSYSIYLWHFAVYYVEGAYIHRKLLLNPPFVLEALLAVLSAIFFGMLMTWLIEKPFLVLRGRLWPSKATVFDQIVPV